MFRTAYDTTACRNVIMTPIIIGIRQHRVASGDQLKMATNPLTEKDMWMVSTLVGGHAQIPAFGHPVLIPDENNEDSIPTVCVDVRNFTRRNQDGAVVVSATMDYYLAIVRGFFQDVWVRYSPRDILTMGNYQITIYARWLSELLTKRYALPPETQMLLTILSGYFYLNMFLDDSVTELDNDEYIKMASQISRATYINTEDVLNVVEGLPVLKSVEDYVNLIVKEAGTVRFEDLSVAALYTVVSGSWFGANAKEITFVALEHPPTFVAMVVQAAQERGYKNTVFGKIIEQYKRDDDLKSFLLNAKRLQRE